MATDDDLVRTLLIIVGIVFLFPFLMMLFVWPMMGTWGGGHMWDGGMWGGTGTSWGWLVMWLVLLVLLGGGGYLLYRASSSPEDGKTDGALEELRLAYARGELSDEEFETRRERLQQSRTRGE